MPLGLWNLPWLVQNSQRAYPLTSRATKTDTTGTIRLPDSFLLGLHLPVSSGLQILANKFFIRSLLISPAGYNIVIGYGEGDAIVTVAAVNVARISHTENRVYAFNGLNSFEDCVGQLVVGSLLEIEQLPPGQYYFTPAATELEVDTIRTESRGISAITVVNGDERSPRIYGDVELVAGNNIRLTTELIVGQPPRIIISAISGEGLNADCVCDEEELGPCIRAINGVSPSTSGEFRLLGDDCLTITPVAGGLQVTDNCSQPCCGCEQLDRINVQLDAMGNQLLTLNNFVGRLQTEVTQMSQVVLGSRLGDRQCISC